MIFNRRPNEGAKKALILPSILKNEIPYSPLHITDWYLILVLYMMPTCFLGFMPERLLHVSGFMDYRLLTFLLSLPLVLIGPRATNNKFWKIPGIWLLCLVGLTVILRAAWSLARGVPLFEVVAVLRWNYTWSIYAVCVLHYLSRLSASRLYSVLRMFLLLFSIQVFLLAVSLFLNVDFFLNKSSLDKILWFIHRGLEVNNLRAFPVHIFVGTAFLFMTVLGSNRWRMYHTLFLLAQMLPLLLTRRMYTITLLFQTSAIYFLVVLFAKKSIKGIYFFCIPFLCLFTLLVIYAVAPVRINIWLDRTLPVLQEGCDPEEAGTYSFRLRLLEDAIQSVEDNERWLWGMGYHREYNITGREGYSYVMGEDTFVASVIYCEGWGGLFLRVMPYLLLLWCNLKRLLWARDVKMKLYAATVVGVIIAQIPAYLQTALICRYDYFYVPLAAVELIVAKGQENRDKA